MNKIFKMLLTVALVSMMSIQSVSAIEGCFGADIRVRDSNTLTAISSAWIVNTSNSSSHSNKIDAQFNSSNSTGWFNLSCLSASDVILRINASGYTEVTNKTGSTSYNSSMTIDLTPAAPAGATLTATSITKDSAVLGWTATEPVDNVTGSVLGAGLIYTASGIVNSTETFSNSTTAPSFTATNLRAGQLYTFYAYTYNTVAKNYGRDGDSTTFTTLKAGVSSSYDPATGLYAEEVSPAPSEDKGALAVLTGGSKTSSQRNVIIVTVVAIIGIIAYFGIYTKQGGKRRK